MAFFSGKSSVSRPITRGSAASTSVSGIVTSTPGAGPSSSNGAVTSTSAIASSSNATSCSPVVSAAQENLSMNIGSTPHVSEDSLIRTKGVTTPPTIASTEILRAEVFTPTTSRSSATLVNSSQVID